MSQASAQQSMAQGHMQGNLQQNSVQPMQGYSQGHSNMGQGQMHSGLSQSNTQMLPPRGVPMSQMGGQMSNHMSGKCSCIFRKLKFLHAYKTVECWYYVHDCFSELCFTFVMHSRHRYMCSFIMFLFKVNLE